MNFIVKGYSVSMSEYRGIETTKLDNKVQKRKKKPGPGPSVVVIIRHNIKGASD